VLEKITEQVVDRAQTGYKLLFDSRFNHTTWASLLGRDFIKSPKVHFPSKGFIVQGEIQLRPDLTPYEERIEIARADFYLSFLPEEYSENVPASERPIFHSAADAYAALMLDPIMAAYESKGDYWNRSYMPRPLKVWRILLANERGI